MDNKNPFGKIIYDRNSEKIIVKLTESITKNKITSDLLELRPHLDKETFNPLTQKYSVMVDGFLITEESKESDHILIGSVTGD